MQIREVDLRRRRVAPTAATGVQLELELESVTRAPVDIHRQRRIRDQRGPGEESDPRAEAVFVAEEGLEVALTVEVALLELRRDVHLDPERRHANSVRRSQEIVMVPDVHARSGAELDPAAERGQPSAHQAVAQDERPIWFAGSPKQSSETRGSNEENVFWLQ